MFGYIVASLIFTVLMYALLFQIHEQNVEACEGRNNTRTEITEQGEALKFVIDVLSDSSFHTVHDFKEARKKIDPVPALDCDEAFSHPWPF